jgi:hypothetical protein
MKYSILFVSMVALGCGGQQKPAPQTPQQQPVEQPQPVQQPVQQQPVQQPVQQPDPPGKAVNVLMRVETIRKGETQAREVQPGDVMHSGDRFALNLKVDRPAYVYVLYAYGGSKKPADQLFPETGHRQLQPGVEVRVPGPSDWVVLDKDTGEENLFVIASRSKMALDELRKRVDEERTDQPDKRRGGKKSAGKKDGGSGGLGQLSAATRGGKIQRGGGDTGGGEGEDHAVLRFSFHHK